MSRSVSVMHCSGLGCLGQVRHSSGTLKGLFFKVLSFRKVESRLNWFNASFVSNESGRGPSSVWAKSLFRTSGWTFKFFWSGKIPRSLSVVGPVALEPLTSQLIVHALTVPACTWHLISDWPNAILVTKISAVIKENWIIFFIIILFWKNDAGNSPTYIYCITNYIKVNCFASCLS